MTLGDIDASDDFFRSSIQFLTSGGACEKINHPQLGEVYAIYKFWWAEDAAAGVRGWYLQDDGTGKYPQNDREINAGDAFCANLDVTEPNATLNYAGEVDGDDNQLEFAHTKFSYVGNATPVDITLGDIDASDDFYRSSIQFLTAGGACEKINHPQLGMVYAIYKFWWAEDADAKVRGWYLQDDGTGKYPQNDREIKAGEAFCVNLDVTEPNATITIPSALPKTK